MASPSKKIETDQHTAQFYRVYRQWDAVYKEVNEKRNNIMSDGVDSLATIINLKNLHSDLQATVEVMDALIATLPSDVERLEEMKHLCIGSAVLTNIELTEELINLRQVLKQSKLPVKNIAPDEATLTLLDSLIAQTDSFRKETSKLFEINSGNYNDGMKQNKEHFNVALEAYKEGCKAAIDTAPDMALKASLTALLAKLDPMFMRKTQPENAKDVSLVSKQGILKEAMHTIRDDAQEKGSLQEPDVEPRGLKR